MMNYSKYFPIIEYYKRFVIPLKPNRYHIKSEKMMVCPLHNDHDPSMGVIKSKNGEEIFHCFGCGKWGNVVQLHIGVCKRLLGKYLTEDQAIRDLCKIFNVDYQKIPKIDAKVELDRDIKNEVEVDKAINQYDISDFRQMITDGKLKKKGIGYFNTVLMIMLNEVKNE